MLPLPVALPLGRVLPPRHSPLQPFVRDRAGVFRVLVLPVHVVILLAAPVSDRRFPLFDRLVV